MQNSNSKKQTGIIYSLSIIIPIVMMIIISVILGMYPFGERTILITDMNKQYNDYFAYFKTIMTGENNLIYTFSKTLGGDMVGFSGYYLQNPFLFLLLLFPNDILPLGVWIMIILQIACCSLTFNIYLNHTYAPSKMSIIFSLAYAFLGYTFGYINLTNYFCNIIVLPLVILGIQRLYKNHKDCWLYIITLAVSILLNYYIGFMLCIFSALFFAYLLFSNTENVQQIKKHFKQILSFLVSSILGILLTAFDLIPIVISLKGQKSVPNGDVLSFYRNFHMIDIFSKLYSNMFDGNTSNNNLPFIYVSMIAVIFVIFFFLSKKITKREKIVTFVFIVVMLLSFYIHTIDVIWHGFNSPVGFPYRNAFYFSFLLLYIAYKGFLVSYEQFRIRDCSIFAGIFVLYSIYLIFTNRSALVFRSVIFDSLLLLVVIGILYGVLYKKWTEQILFFALLTVQIIDLSANSVTSIKQYTDYVPMREYSEYVNEVAPLTQYVANQDQSLYRVEKNFMRTMNDTMQFNFKGLSHSSSCEKDYVKAFMEKMGFRNFGLWTYYDEGGTAFVDCFLGVKYYISKFDATGKPYDLIYQENEKYVFQNPYALPFAFGVSEGVHLVDMKEQNSFLLQNRISNAISNQNQPIYIEVEQENPILENLSETSQDLYRIYEKKNSNEDAYIDFQLTITDSQPIYLFFEAPEQQAAEITVNDFSFGNYFSDTKWDIIEIGSFSEGDTVSVKLYVKGDELKLGNAYFYYEDKDALIAMSEGAGSEVADLKCISNSHLQGTVEIKNSDELLFTIPYETDWKIYIDGIATKQSKVFDALMTVPVEEGTHTIEIYYVPRGFIIGSILSLIALLILMIFGIHEKRASKQNEKVGKEVGKEELKLI